MTAEKNRPMCAALMSIADAARRGCRPLPIIRTDVATVVAIQRAINFEMGGQIANAARDQTRHWPWAMYDGLLVLCDQDKDPVGSGRPIEYWEGFADLWGPRTLDEECRELLGRTG